jgi:hypothetical protein
MGIPRGGSTARYLCCFRSDNRSTLGYIEIVNVVLPGPLGTATQVSRVDQTELAERSDAVALLKKTPAS